MPAVLLRSIPRSSASTREPSLLRYTFPRAMVALAKDAYARAALATMAFALGAGVLGGRNA